jgi:cellulose synthase/poly-beta-1,6-N-acetylglucosamine synthase-like glycosyltransferase
MLTTMDVETVDEQTVSFRSVGLYGGLTLAIVAIGLLPALLSWSYIRALKTVILLVILVQLARLTISAFLSIPRSAEPPEFESEERPMVSVIIPAYNEASVLPETIDACLDLDYPKDKLEVIICYEADCTDDTGPIAEQAAEEHDLFRAVERDEEGGGKAMAANYALDYVEGDIIASIDADHQFEADAVERAVRWFDAEPETWCVKGRCYGRNPTDSLVALYATVDRHIVEKVELFSRQVFGGFTLFGGGQAFFRRKVFDEVGKFDEEILVEDIDLSAKLHAEGKTIRMDPEVITHEEQPATVLSWWSQRKRWARGWMQVSVRHLGRILRSSGPSNMAKADATQTFSYNLLLPLLVVGMPLPLLDLLEQVGFFDTAVPLTAYVPYSRVLWTILGIFPVIAAAAMFYSDRRDGHSHHPREYVAALTIGAFLLVNSLVYIVAFIEEFVLRQDSVYVTTARADEDDV